MSGWQVILALKVAVVALTVMLAASLVALAAGNRRLHGQLNTAFAALTIAALAGLELLVRLIQPGLFDYFDGEARRGLRVHLAFAAPAALLLPVMLYTGRRRRRLHVALAALFATLWLATVATGLFLLPHRAPGG